MNKAYKFNKFDEFYTPYKIVKYIVDNLQIPKDKIIWCPFDTKESFFVKYLKEQGYQVINSHYNPETKIGKDFYTYEPKNWDIILSNPPFSNKTALIKRLLDLTKDNDKRWILLMGTQLFQTGSFVSEFNNLSNLSFIFFEKRIYYQKNYDLDFKPTSKPAFQSCLISNKLFNDKMINVWKGV